jgi:hypothetical protein
MRPTHADMVREWRSYLASLREHLARVRLHAPEVLQRLQALADSDGRDKA